jgi:hypothetical protein
MAYIRQYHEAEKFRCVDKATIYPDIVKGDVEARYFGKASISNVVFEKFWRDRMRARPGPVNESSAIENNFRYLFDRRSPPYHEGRFNTASFAALYTAKDPETAKAERLHHVERRTIPFEYVVYSIVVNKKVADLRPYGESGEFVPGEAYDPCQKIAEELRSKLDGIAWRSVRYSTGSCCAFFSCNDIVPGAVVESGQEAPA